MKVVGVVLGIATAVILGALVNLGIKAFYPEPASPQYMNYPIAAPCATKDVPCQTEQTKLQQKQQDQWQAGQVAWQAQMNVYNSNLFIVANVIGMLIFAVGFWLIFGGAKLGSVGAPVGMMLAGLWSIIYGYARGWGSVNDQLKFLVGLVIAILVIGGSVWLMQRYQKAHSPAA